ncbi:MAG: Lsm family RNA-binding protein [Nitrososphaerota archaeon]|nr:Lsm family RNA-binding protein [Nitrososphaerales archaeon]MDW8044911.1 Lsm family RNA-binding protein [Nitrososphaerota archaeon]
MSSIIQRKYSEELSMLIGKTVAIETSDGKNYQGELLAIDENLNIILNNPIGVGENIYKLIINGDYIKEIKLIERPFQLRALAERLNRVFPGMVKLREDIGTIIVMDKIKVTEQGVVEGTGLAAERVKSVYEEFMKEYQK